MGDGFLRRLRFVVSYPFHRELEKDGAPRFMGAPPAAAAKQTRKAPVTPKFLRLLVFITVSASLALCATRAQTQVPAHSQTLTDQQFEQMFVGAENSWRLTAFDIQSQRDPVAPSIRAAHNASWQSVLQPYRDMEMRSGQVVYNNCDLPTSRELNLDPDEIWVIARFDHFRVVSIDPDFQLLYTEMTFKITRVVYQPKASSVAPGMSFETEVDGGRIKKPNGDIVTWRLKPDRYSVQPGHSYLMQINRAHDGSLVFGFGQWDVSTGRAVPDAANLIGYAQDGSSKISGKTAEEAIAYLQSALSASSSK